MTRTEARNAAIQNLLAAAEAGNEVYNVDFTNWKDHANRAFYEATQEAQRVHLDGDRSNQSSTTLYYEMPNGLHNFPSRKFTALVEKSDDTPMRAAVIALINEWKPVADAIAAVKKNVIKGRKPSDTPRKTPERTLENTGTCAVCGHNVKLDSEGNIVHHGFRVQYGMRNGSCYGVGFKPIEVSPKGAYSYLNMITAMLETSHNTLASINEMDAPLSKEMVRAKLNVEGDIRTLAREIAYYTNVVSTWEAKPLPGTN